MQLDIIGQMLFDNNYPKDKIVSFIRWKIIDTSVKKALPIEKKKYKGTTTEVAKKLQRYLSKVKDLRSDATLEALRAIAPDEPIGDWEYFIATDRAIKIYLETRTNLIITEDVVYRPNFMKILEDELVKSLED